KRAADFEVRAEGNKIRVIEALDGQLITPEIIEDVKVVDGKAVSDADKDILKIAVVNRYKDTKPAVAFIKNFGLKAGAIASSVGQDSDKMVVVGVDDVSIAQAVNRLIEAKGGIVVGDGDREELLPLPVAVIMSTDDGYTVADRY